MRVRATVRHFEMIFFICYLDLPRFGRHLMDDDIRLITRAGHRRLGDEDFADIFDFGEGMPSLSIYYQCYIHVNEAINF